MWRGKFDWQVAMGTGQQWQWVGGKQLPTTAANWQYLADTGTASGQHQGRPTHT